MLWNTQHWVQKWRHQLSFSAHPIKKLGRFDSIEFSYTSRPIKKLARLEITSHPIKKLGRFELITDSRFNTSRPIKELDGARNYFSAEQNTCTPVQHGISHHTKSVLRLMLSFLVFTLQENIFNLHIPEKYTMILIMNSRHE